MSLSYCADTSAANWIIQSRTPPTQLIYFGPAGFEAYARLRFIPDPTMQNQAEADVARLDSHLPDLTQARRALHLLSQFTETAQDCYFCAWDGYSDVDLSAAASQGSFFSVPDRRLAMLQGSLSAIDNWGENFGADTACPPPALMWPADHSWCFASDVDPHWAGIGASRAAIDALLVDLEIDVVMADPAKVQPSYI